MISPHDIEAIERATVAAVAPPVVEELDGWLLCFDDGTVGRAKSAVPLRHAPLDPAVIGRAQQRYAQRGLPAIFRLPVVADALPFEGALVASGYVQTKPTDVMVAAAREVADTPPGVNVRLDPEPDDTWVALFLGPSFDPVDGASRVRTLRRAHGSLYASIKDGEATVAAGVLALGHGWASVHAMRTALSHRGRGYARSVLATFARSALGGGIKRMVLQVEAGNEVAKRLYAHSGFRPAWRYAYWEEPPQK